MIKCGLMLVWEEHMADRDDKECIANAALWAHYSLGVLNWTQQRDRHNIPPMNNGVTPAMVSSNAREREREEEAEKDRGQHHKPH